MTQYLMREGRVGCATASGLSVTVLTGSGLMVAGPVIGSEPAVIAAGSAVGTPFPSTIDLFITRPNL